MVRRGGLMRSAFVAAGLLLVAGCGRSAPPSGRPAAPQTHLAAAPSTGSVPHTAASAPSASPSSSSGAAGISTTVSVVNPSNFPGCNPANLSLTLTSQAVGAGTHIRIYAFHNTADSTCTLFGYPGLELLDSQGQPITTNVTQVTDQENLVTLAPKGQAWFVVQYPDSQGVNPNSCPASAELAVTVPQSTAAIVLKGRAGAIRAYGAGAGQSGCGQLDVQPVSPPGVPLNP